MGDKRWASVAQSPDENVYKHAKIQIQCTFFDVEKQQMLVIGQPKWIPNYTPLSKFTCGLHGVVHGVAILGWELNTMQPQDLKLSG